MIIIKTVTTVSIDAYEQKDGPPWRQSVYARAMDMFLIDLSI